jgi:hypothetical protein
MRPGNVFIILSIVLSPTLVMAQTTVPSMAPPPVSGDLPGPVVNGRHRQPTEAEIRARERAEGQATPALQQRNREESKDVDDLYKELTTPLPPLTEQGGAPEK